MPPETRDSQHGTPTAVAVGLNAVIIAVTDGTPRLLTVRRARHELAEPQTGDGDGHARALPFGPLQLDVDRTLQQGLRRWVRDLAGLELGYVEQLYTFGDADRELHGPLPVLSVAYLALANEVPPGGSGEAQWLDIYDLLPWEDWRDGRPAAIETEIIPAVRRWAEDAPSPAVRAAREERVAITFGVGAPWDAVRALDRYELLYEAGLVEEALRDRAVRTGTRFDPAQVPAWQGRSLVLDHRRIAATALSRLRGKLTYRPVVFELVPPTFTLSQLQRVVEALNGATLHTQNFRRLVERGGLVEPTGEQVVTKGRPAALFRFRREVLRERARPGVGLPGTRAG